MLVRGKSPLNDIALEAALCLSLLDSESVVAREFLLQCLSQGDLKKKMKALMVLVKLMNIQTLPILRAIMEQLQYSFVVKHRIEAAKLLKVFGLEMIQNLGMENEIFELLKSKIHEEPCQEVKEAVAEIVNDLNMKPLMLNILESQLNDDDVVTRCHAIVSLGVLGVGSSHIFYLLMDMLDMDPSEIVKKEVEKLFIALSKKDPWVRAKLKDWELLTKEEAKKKKAREDALKNRKIRREFRIKQTNLLGHLGSVIPKRKPKSRKSISTDSECLVFNVPIKGLALASDYPPCVPVKKKSTPHLEGIWDTPVIREHLKKLAAQ